VSEKWRTQDVTRGYTRAAGDRELRYPTRRLRFRDPFLQRSGTATLDYPRRGPSWKPARFRRCPPFTPARSATIEVWFQLRR
jgi:hypothetical protein